MRSRKLRGAGQEGRDLDSNNIGDLGQEEPNLRKKEEGRGKGNICEGFSGVVKKCFNHYVW